jgi:hypothetical protein
MKYQSNSQREERLLDSARWIMGVSVLVDGGSREEEHGFTYEEKFNESD